jgi:hypothetical protein
MAITAARVIWRSAVVLVLSIGMSVAADMDVRGFAECINNSGAKYYGAHWCPYCRKQNRLFGNDFKYVPYVACSQRGSRQQLDRCSHISGYPTWVFANGKKRSSVLSFEELTKYTGCRLQEKSYFVN